MAYCNGCRFLDRNEYLTTNLDRCMFKKEAVPTATPHLREKVKFTYRRYVFAEFKNNSGKCADFKHKPW